MSDFLKKVAVGVIIAIVVDKTKPYVEEALNDLHKHYQSKLSR